jgi:hypothetical protein
MAPFFILYGCLALIALVLHVRDRRRIADEAYAAHIEWSIRAGGGHWSHNESVVPHIPEVGRGPSPR